MTDDVVDAVTQVFAEELGWSAAEADAERERVLTVLADSRGRAVRIPANSAVHAG